MLVTTPRRHKFRFAPQFAQQHKGRADNIGVDAQFRRRARRRGNEPGGGVAREREAHHSTRQHLEVAAAFHRQAAGDRAGENGEKGRGFHESVAAGQFLPREAIRQNAVFDRPEQRAERAEQKQRDKQNLDGVRPKAGDRDARRGDFNQLDASRDGGFVEFIGELSAQRRQQEIRRHQHDAGERHQRGAGLAANPE